MLVRSLCVIAAAGALACRAPRAAAPAAAPSPAAPPEAAAPASDPGVQLVYAWARARGGQPESALALLEKLDAGGWDVPIDPADFPALAADPAFQALAARTAAREPRTPHAATAIRVEEPGLVAEGLAADAAGNVYLGSIARRKIVRVAPGGAATDLVPAGAGGLLAPLGLEVDAPRGLLWAASNALPSSGAWAAAERGRSALLAFDLATGAPRLRVEAEGPGHLLNDVAVGPDGAAYVTDSEPGAVLVLRPGTGKLEVLVPPGRLTYPNGIVAAPEGLLVAHAFGIEAVPYAGGETRPLATPGFPLGGLDGLALRGRTLVGVQNGLGKPRIVRLALAAGEPRVLRGEVLETANPAWHLPTTGDLAGDAFLYVANSHVDALSAPTLDAAQVPTLVLRLPLR